MIIQGALRCQKEGGRGGCALKVRNGCTMDVLMNIQGGARRDAGWDSSPAHVVKALKPEPSKTGVSVCVCACVCMCVCAFVRACKSKGLCGATQVEGHHHGTAGRHSTANTTFAHARPLCFISFQALWGRSIGRALSWHWLAGTALQLQLCQSKALTRHLIAGPVGPSKWKGTIMADRTPRTSLSGSIPVHRAPLVTDRRESGGGMGTKTGSKGEFRRSSSAVAETNPASKGDFWGNQSLTKRNGKTTSTKKVACIIKACASSLRALQSRCSRDTASRQSIKPFFTLIARLAAA
eukprot:1148253-Pelagomonas_calceolata.AAC.6